MVASRNARALQMDMLPGRAVADLVWPAVVTEWLIDRSCFILKIESGWHNAIRPILKIRFYGFLWSSQMWMFSFIWTCRCMFISTRKQFICEGYHVKEWEACQEKSSWICCCAYQIISMLMCTLKL
jgi:hypothetical protein